MKVVAFNGSPRKNGNTFWALNTVVDELKKESIEAEIINVGSNSVQGCLGCGHCIKNKERKCIITKDSVNEWVEKMHDADGLILGSPVYFSGVAGTMKSFLDRAFYMTGGTLRNKIGAAVVAVRRSGGLTTFNQLNHYLTYAEMLIPSSKYWNVIHGTMPGDAQKDEEGVQIMRVLGKNMAYLLKMRNESTIKEPESEKKIFTSFIR